MGKKTILYDKFSSKFNYYKYEPQLYSGEINYDIESAKTYPNYLSECRNINISFFNKLRELISIRDVGLSKSIDCMFEKNVYSEIRSIIRELKGSKIVICGTGIHINMLKPILAQENINIVAYTGRSFEGGLYGVSCDFVSENELNKIEFDYIIISSFLYAQEMMEDLNKQGIESKKIINIYQKLNERGVTIDYPFYSRDRVRVILK